MIVRSGAVARANGWRFWLIAGYCLIVVMLALLWVFSLLTPISQTEEEQQYQSLSSIADTGAALLKNSTLNAQDSITAIGSDGKVRATLIDKSGHVIADNVDNVSKMEDHSQRPEVKAALESGMGQDRRVSTTDGTEYLYLAKRVEYKDSTAVLRTSVQASQVTSFAETFRTTSSAALAIAILITIFVAVYTFRRTSAPVTRLERVRTNFVANASHELKTPVAGIRLLSESIERACKDKDIESVSLFTERLQKESLRLQNLVTELLDLSRLENGGLKRRSKETVDALAIASTSYEGHIAQAREKGIAFSFDDGGASTPLKVELGAADTSLIVDNLLENAINYTEAGEVKLRVFSSDKNVVVEVSDTGIGIPQADQERIFERFYRVDTARSREMGGTGLGLSLVRHAVNRAGGYIELMSAPGQGSTFTVTLPKAAI